jgi:hypothetical protein
MGNLNKNSHIGPVSPKDPKNALEDLYLAAKEEDLGKAETGSNRGPFVDMLNDAAGVPHGSPWCATWVMYRVKKTAAKWGVKITAFLDASVMSMVSKNHGRLHKEPRVGDICLMQHGNSSFGHCGIVGPINNDGTHACIEGNTSDDDPTTRNGGQVAIHERGPRGQYGNLHVIGYLTPFDS